MEKRITDIRDTFRDGRAEAPHVVPMLEIERFDQWSDRGDHSGRSVRMCYCLVDEAG